MEQEQVQPGRETCFCQLCGDLLKDPVTIPCGHSLCMNCIKSFWDEKDEKETHSCPLCGQTFTPRPALVRSPMLADLVAELRKTGLQDAPTGPEDAACYFCPGRKAHKSCLTCRISYCVEHLQSHYDIPSLRKHKLVEPSALRENICPRHGEVMKMFCRTDDRFICHQCLKEEHIGHDTVSAAAERIERQRQLEENIQERKEKLKVLQQEVEAINRSADEAVEDSETVFNELMRFIKGRSSDVKQRIRTQRETEVSRVRELQEKLQQEVTELKRKDAELKKLSLTGDHNPSLKSYLSLSQLLEATHSIGFRRSRPTYFEEVTTAVSKLGDKLQEVLSETWTSISWAAINVDVLLNPDLYPKSRDEFLEHARKITLDPDTALAHISILEGNSKALNTSWHQNYTFRDQVWSREVLTGRRYWEVEWSGDVAVAVTCKSFRFILFFIKNVFGDDDKSWVLKWNGTHYVFRYNNTSTFISGPLSSRIGVYLDHSAGILSFYSISEKMTLLHRVQTTFTQPLYAGLCIPPGSTAEFCEPIYV